MKIKFSYLFIFLFIFHVYFGLSQKDSTWYDISAVVYLDSLTIIASRNDFSVQDFIRIVQEDRSMEKAFQNIRFQAYTFENNIQFFDKSGSIKASYSSINNQNFKKACRSMRVLSESITGKYFKRNGSYKYYTSALYDRVFYTHGTVCDKSTSMVSYIEKEDPKSKMEKQILELKKLIFNPGQRSEVILIGDKMEIFSPELQKYYNYEISQGNEPGGKSCYIFSAKVKDEYEQSNKVVVHYIDSYFERGTMDILARNYGLAYKTPAYAFNVKMKVRLNKIEGLHIPTQIEYDGIWKITGFKTERAAFSTKLYNFVTE